MLAFVTLLWGSSFLLIKVASQAFEPAALAFGRAGIAAAALALAALAMRLSWPRSRRLWGRMAAMSLCGQALPFLLLGAAARLTSSADMALMMGGVPIFTFLLARLFGLGEVWNARAALGLALGLVGVVVSLGSPLGAVAAATGEPGLGRAWRCSRPWLRDGRAVVAPVSREIGPPMAATGSMLVSAGLLFGLVADERGPPPLSALRRRHSPRSPRFLRSACSTPRSPISFTFA